MRKARLSQATIQQLIEHFVAGTPARASAPLCKINRLPVACLQQVGRQVIPHGHGIIVFESLSTITSKPL